MSCALSIKDLTCKYESQTILEALSLEVEHGEIVCLLGASGCGKTTLLKAIAGLLPLSSGVMSLNCQTIDDSDNWLPPEQRNIGMIFQDYALFPHLTVKQNVGFGLKELSEQQKKEKVQEMLELVHLDEFGDRYPHQLSGGQQQRVAIARSLAYKPDLLLLDEPFSNIDTQVRHELISQMRKIFKKQGVTAIFVTALQAGTFSRFGVTRQIVNAIFLLVAVKMVESVVTEPVRSDPALWPLVYTPTVVGIAIVVTMLFVSARPFRPRRRRSEAAA